MRISLKQLCFLALYLITSSTVWSQTISGEVFRDYNANGVKDTREPGVSGIVVDVIDITGLSVGNATTVTDGTYSAAISVGAGVDVRVEFSGMPAYLKPGASGTNSNSTVVFVQSGDINVDVGLNNPAQYCQTPTALGDLTVVTSCFVNGQQAGSADDVMVSFDYLSGDTGPAGNVDLPAKTSIADAQDIGSVYGMAYQRRSNSLFSGSYMKRHVSFLTDGGTGKIFLTNTTMGTSIEFLDINGLFGASTTGNDPHPSGTNLARDNNNNGANGSTNESWDAVGKRAFGDLEISDDELTLYAVNLADKSLYNIPLGSDPENPVAPTLSTQIDVNAIPSPCSNSNDARPFALGVNDDVVYVGGVCSAESTQNTNDLSAYVYSYTSTSGFSALPILTFPINHPRGCAVVSGCASANWNPWASVFVATVTNFGGEYVYPQPMLTDIEFDNGDLILGFRDRFGDQTGFNQLSTNSADATLYTGDSAGGILRACDDGAGTLILESNGSCGTLTGAGTGNGKGPGGGEFYVIDYPDHDQVSLAGLAMAQGFNDLAFTMYDPIFSSSEFFDGGNGWNNITGGASSRRFRIYSTNDTDPNTFAKGGGLGDEELLCNAAPIEIGNRVWCDAGSVNGIQDPAEAGAPGVAVRLSCGGEFAEMNTDANGNYLFTSSVWNASANTSTALIPLNTSCAVLIDTALAGNITALSTACGSVTPTQTDATSALPNDDLRDSDGILSGFTVQATVNTSGSNTTGNAGDNDHTIDFGFIPGFNLGDFVWYDSNQNGIQDMGESGVNGVSVDLYNNATCAGASTASTVTANGGMPAADGFYRFSGLVSGMYCVAFSSLPAGYQITGQNVGGDDNIDSDANPAGQIQNINLTADDPSNDMGVFLNGSIAGLTWCESNTNANTMYDAGDGDTLLPNIQITLYNDANCSNTVDGGDVGTAATQDTNGSGAYLFANLPVGPVGNALCYITEVDSGDADLSVCNSNITSTTLAPDLDTSIPNSIDNNFGFEENIGLGDFVWYDSNQNGVQDMGESGVNGVSVDLYNNATCAGASTASTVTANGGMPAADGFYRFGGLASGMYCVAFSSLPAGYQITGQNVGGDDNIDSDANPAGQIQNINLTADDPSNDMGVFLNGSIAGLTWCESNTNANTMYDAGDGDTLLPNIQITLYNDANCSNTVDGGDAGTAATQDTNGSGAYLFANLPVGSVGNALCYITEVDVSDPDLGACNTGITSSTNEPDLDTNTPNITDNNFGFDDLLGLGDYVWYDNNQNGIQDLDEPGVNGITVNLYDNGTCSAPSVDSTVTLNGGIPASDGYYFFTNLDAGSYCVEFSNLPAGFVFTGQNQGGDDSVDSDVDTVTGQVQNIDLSSVNPTIDAGVYASIGSISGLFYCDDSPFNGVLDIGEEVSNVTVSLSRDFDCDDVGDVFVGSLNTDAMGGFQFNNLPVALSPAPPNPLVCYVIDYDSNGLGGCSVPITPITQITTLDTSMPVATPVIFGVMLIQMIPVNTWWALLILIAGILVSFKMKGNNRQGVRERD